MLTRVSWFLVSCVVAVVGSPWLAAAAEPPLDTSRGDEMIAAYFREETAKLAQSSLAHDKSLAEWKLHRETYRRQLLEMLGLDPWPERTDLQVQITGTVEKDEFRVEKLVFQSRPGLYVTGNLYLPKKIEGRLPAILYVCGHGNVKKDGISYGSKTAYQHHGAWFARNGYVCLTIDTLQLGEIEGIHHGTYRYGMWWWLNRGYTPAGVEAWNCVRALDYLQSRPEVDPERLGVTGRSGGGAYSWWIAAIDERIKCAVPVAGITDLTNHVVDGCVEGHCDCMFMVNTHRWDYAQVAAMVAPRPLLISNTDSDRIFPLDGVVRVFEQVRGIYTLYGARDKVALNIAAGPHKDIQELQIHAFRWFNHHLKNDDSLVEKVATKFFEPEELKVFQTLPADQLNTRIHEEFVPAAAIPPAPRTAAEWESLAQQWRQALQEKVFAGWPAQPESLQLRMAATAAAGDLTLRAYDFVSQGPFPLRLFTIQPTALSSPELVVLNVLDETSWSEFEGTLRAGFESQLDLPWRSEPRQKDFESLQQMLTANKWAFAYVAPRGVGPTAWDQSERKQVQHQRRFYLLGQTLDAMRVWDIRRAIQTVRLLDSLGKSPLWLQGTGRMAGNVLYAALFEPEIARIDLHQLPASHRDGPFLLNVQRFLDTPQAVALAGQQTRVVLYGDDPAPWQWPRDLASHLKWNANQLQFRHLKQE